MLAEGDMRKRTSHLLTVKVTADSSCFSSDVKLPDVTDDCVHLVCVNSSDSSDAKWAKGGENETKKTRNVFILQKCFIALPL